MIGALFIGLAIRGYVVVQPPSSAMLWDHHEYVRWGVLMHEEGFAALYDHPPRETLMCDRKAGACGVAHHPKHFIRRACNYPPLAGWVLYAQIEVLRWFDPSMASNTVAARVIYAWLSMIGDCLIAAGCFVIVRRFGSALAGAVAFAVILLAPPFVIDSARWTQTDSWVLAPLVWAVWAMLSRRWLTAGLLWGVALGLKTQGILLAPVCGFAFILGPQRPRMVLAGLLAVMVLFLASIPFTLHSGLKWFEEAYVNNLVGLYKDTTLKAFNVWYVDLLLCENLDASLKLLGLEKDTWGKFLLATVMFGSAILLIRRRACYRSAILTFTAATLLAAVLLPTRVHERYIILPIPFLVMAAMWRPRMWLALVPFLAAASVQMTALDWLGRTRGAGSWPEVLQWHKTQTLPELNEEYEYLRTALPKEDFARLLPPEEHLEKICRTQYLKVRAEVAPKEWALTVVEIISAGVLFVLLLLPLHGVRNDDGLA
ncbi:MAG: hypothetical protein KAV82_00605 [Phycisphaerae bacterium]|nr:hypothetical protein [Phycisphaerae bacterium]